MKSNNKILIVEDDPNFGSILKDTRNLKAGNEHVPCELFNQAEIRSSGYNVFKEDDDCRIIQHQTDITDDPKLGFLSDWGSNTLSFELREDSPAVDLVPRNLCLAVTNRDQKGGRRPLRDICDAGAYELRRKFFDPRVKIRF